MSLLTPMLRSSPLTDWFSDAQRVQGMLDFEAALAQAQADFVVLGGQLTAIADARLQAVHTLTIVKQNLAWALVYNAAGVPLAMLGWMPAWAAGLGMAASSLLVVLNALRLSGARALEGV